MNSDLRAVGARIDALIGGDPGREDLVREVTNLYGAGLERLLSVLHEAGALTDEVADAIAGDDLISALLLVHGLHPDSTGTRVRRALAGTGVELIDVTEAGVCRLRTKNGHHPPTDIEQRIEAAAPEISDIELVAVIPVESLFSRLAAS